MTTFNDANVDNRLRYMVRGRVIVATTSKVVEFLDEALTHSYPLYSVDDIPEGKVLTFCVEVSGFLTFDIDSFVRILPEARNFEKVHYDPTAFALVRSADPTKKLITNAVASNYSRIEGTDPPLYNKIYVYVQASPTTIQEYVFVRSAGLQLDELWNAARTVFPVGEALKPVASYTDFTVTVGNILTN